MNRDGIVRPRGRPLLSREEVGYDVDIANLARLRTALLADTRLSTRKYNQASKALATVESILKELPKANKREPNALG